MRPHHRPPWAPRSPRSNLRDRTRRAFPSEFSLLKGESGPVCHSFLRRRMGDASTPRSARGTSLSRGRSGGSKPTPLTLKGSHLGMGACAATPHRHEEAESRLRPDAATQARLRIPTRSRYGARDLLGRATRLETLAYREMNPQGRRVHAGPPRSTPVPVPARMELPRVARLLSMGSTSWPFMSARA